MVSARQRLGVNNIPMTSMGLNKRGSLYRVYCYLTTTDLLTTRSQRRDYHRMDGNNLVCKKCELSIVLKIESNIILRINTSHRRLKYV